MKKHSTQSGRKKGKSNALPASLKRVNLNAAGIDIGSEEHYVAVPEDRDEEAVRCFKCFTPDLHEMARWLKHCGIETVAMESTGVYWIPVFQILEHYGLEVKLVDACRVKNVPGRKTDVLDCQWLQQLHTYGLLAGAFIPDKEISILRGYWRHRAGLVQSCSKQIQLMQKALIQMNLHLHKALSDITGVTGMAIIRAIVQGERDPKCLARMRQRGVKSSEKTIADALTGNWREEQLFILAQSLELYDIYQQKIAQCDLQVDQYMATLEAKADPKELASKPKKRSKTKRRKNEPHFDLRASLYRMTGVDLTLIDGIDAMTAQTIISECGFDMSRFPTAKHFASWLGLCPNNRKTGGKVFKTKTRNVRNRAADALRLAAQSLHSSKSALGAFLRRLRTRLGAPKAITAAAHKLAILVYRMLKYGEDYVDKGQWYYEEKYRHRVVNNIKQRAKTMGYALVSLETGEVVS
jgi:transposase